VIETLPADLTGLASLIGRTPLVRLRQFETKPGLELYAKLESRNPGGSVKDRAALAMMREGERSGALRSDRILLDATSGNTGIAYAMIGASRRYRVRLCVPANVTPERKQVLLAYGAELVLTDPMDGSDGAIREARRLFERDPDQYFYPDQYSNPANWRAHYDTTAVEIIEQTEGRLTHFVAGLGTSGTFVGTARRLREWNASVGLTSVQPLSPLHGLEGLKHMESAIVPAIYDATLADRDERVATEDAYSLVLRLAREEGILVGPSSGAALAACLRIANDIDRGVIVTIFPDGGDRYLSERFWNASGGGAPRTVIDRPGEESESASAAARLSGGGAPRTVSKDDRGLSLHVPADALAAIAAHGARTYPEECCGALLGPRHGVISEAFPLGNETTAERRRRFLIGPEEYRSAERRATETGRELVGFYHSHPDHPAIPSAFDLEHAWPNLSYLIISVRKGQPAESRSWRLRIDRSGYDEELIKS
jgi:S-sulfo-L-cysteine synthase (O-acetyl-L-serine-dependent)